jgi:hypothetical protein
MGKRKRAWEEREAGGGRWWERSCLAISDHRSSRREKQSPAFSGSRSKRKREKAKQPVSTVERNMMVRVTLPCCWPPSRFQWASLFVSETTKIPKTSNHAKCAKAMSADCLECSAGVRHKPPQRDLVPFVGSRELMLTPAWPSHSVCKPACRLL